jgi:response regulator NasT
MLENRDRAIVAGRRIAVAGEACRYQDELVTALVSLGHRAFPRRLQPERQPTDLEQGEPDVVVVVAGRDRGAALYLMRAVRHRGKLPVLAAIECGDDEWTCAAVAAGASGAVVGLNLEGWRATVHAACERFAELRALEQAFERRAVIERAKGILMASQGIAGDDAFGLLRDHSRRTNRRLVEIADAVLNSHELLGRPRRASPKSGPAVPSVSAGDPTRASEDRPRTPKERLLVAKRTRR